MRQEANAADGVLGWQIYPAIGVIWEIYPAIGVIWEIYPAIGVIWQIYPAIGLGICQVLNCHGGEFRIVFSCSPAEW